MAGEIHPFSLSFLRLNLAVSQENGPNTTFLSLSVVPYAQLSRNGDLSLHVVGFLDTDHRRLQLHQVRSLHPRTLTGYRSRFGGSSGEFGYLKRRLCGSTPSLIGSTRLSPFFLSATGFLASQPLDTLAELVLAS